MMEVEYGTNPLDAPTILAALFDELSATTDYCVLRDALPRRLARLLKCRCVLLYQYMGETLQFVSGSFAEQPGWSAELLTVAHINPVELSKDLPEARAWRARGPVCAPLDGRDSGLIALPLIYRQRAIGVLTAIRGSLAQAQMEEAREPGAWLPEEAPLLEMVANMVALLLENTRLLERDRERIHELSLLNGITGQMNCVLHEPQRVYHIVVQRAREISLADLCNVLIPGSSLDAISWIPPELHHRLAQRWSRELQSAPLLLERVGDGQRGDELDSLAPDIKTFFALPLLGKSEESRVYGAHPPVLLSSCPGGEQPARVFGIIVGAYRQAWKLRREEMVLLQVLANQASAVLENITLMEDVIEARNEARSLLRQVLDDQRLKELILESIPSGLITVNEHGRITTFNRAAETVLGYHPREALGQSVLKILAPRGLSSVLQHGQPQREILLTSGRQGQEIALDLSLAPLRDDQGYQIGALLTFADMTGIYRLEEEKRRLDRLASLGEMSACVAHEVRNPLAAIKTSMQLLLEDLEGSVALQQEAHEATSVVLKEIERLDHIVRDLLLFARPRQLHLVECDLMELCRRLLHFFQLQCDERGIRVHFVEQEIPRVHLDPAQMEQALMNILLNALQAMPDGGVLSIACQPLSLPAQPSPLYEVEETRLVAKLMEQQGQKQQTWLDLTVSDTGEGISQEALKRIFQPFYTTRAHGIGLGLPITRRLIEDHHGSLLIESQPGYGTTVSVRLPVDAAFLPAEQALYEEGGSVYREFDRSDR